MLVRKLDEHLWVMRKVNADLMPYCYESRDTAFRAMELPEEDRRALQEAADARLNGAGLITYQDVVAAIAARRL